MNEEDTITKDKKWEVEYYKRINQLSDKYNLDVQSLGFNKIGVIGKYNFTYNDKVYLEIEEIAIGMCEYLRSYFGDEVDYSILSEGFDIVLEII